MTSKGAEGDVPYGRFIGACGVFAAATGLVALIGWATGTAVLASLGSGRIPMAPSTALLLVLYGISVVLRTGAAPRRASVRLSAVVYCTGGLVATALLACSYLEIYPTVEHLGFAAVGTVDGVPVGHMSPATALGFLLASLSLLASPESEALRPRWRAAVAWYVAWQLFAASYVLLLAYVYGTPLMYGGAIVPPAATTCLAFAALAAAALTLAGPQLWRPGEPSAEFARTVSVLLLVFVLLAGSIIAAGYLYFSAYQAQYRAEVERQLSSVAELKVNELAQYRKERLGDGSVFAGNEPFSALAARVLDSSADSEARAELRVWLGKCREHYQYDRVSLLDPRGVEQMSVPESAAPVASVVAHGVAEVLRSGEVVLQDFHRNEHDQRIYLTVLVPIIGGPGGRRALGVLALRIDPETYLYPFMSRWPTFSETAETLLVRREGNEAVFLNALRFRGNSALSLRIPLERTEVPGAAAASGREGIVEGVDYRGVAVIADVRAVPDSPWFLVARMDLSEAYAPLRERMWMTVIFVSVLLIGAGAAVAGVWRHQRAAFYRDQYEAQRDRAWLQDVIARSLNEIYVFDPDTLRFSFANAGACRNIGYTADELERLTPIDIKPGFTEETFLDLVQPLRSGAREVLVFDAVHRRKDGSEYPVEVHLQLVRFGGDSVFLAVINDITERKLAEGALQRQRDLYNMLAQTSQAIVRCRNRDELFAALCRVAIEHGRFLFAWVGLADASRSRVVPVAKYGEDAGYISEFGIWANPSDAAGRGPTGLAFHTGQRVISNDFANDPSTAPWHELGRSIGIRASAAFPLRERGRVIGTFSLYSTETGLFTEDVVATLDEMGSDVSFALDGFALEDERARAVEALRESEYRYRDLVENSQDLICTHDMEGKLLSINEAAVKSTGHSRDALLRMNLVELLEPGSQERFDVYLAELRDHGRARGIMRIRTATGETRFWEYDNTLRTQGSAGPIVRGMAHDVTDRLSAERQRRALERQLRVAQKMEALGTLAGGIAHDFNNILGAIIGNVELARQDVGSGHPATESLEEIRKASYRAKEVVQRILAFGRQQQQPRSVISLRPVLEEAVAMLRAILPSGIELATAFGSETPPVVADPTDIHQVLINLCTNAWQALDGKAGRIGIGLDCVTLDSETAEVDADLAPGRFACLSVTDSGTGMNDATLERMFEPFFTTKPVGGGTGLGLSVVHGIVKAHGGAIRVTSELGVGTTFRVYLPASRAPASETEAGNSAEQPAAVAVGGLRVLYVDDEEALVFLVTRTLERMGFQVTGYTRAQDAVAAVRADPERFDLVITDFNMPGLSGLEIARQLARLRPDLPVVLASGYITDELRAEALEAGVREMIYKPNTVDELCAVVQRVATAAGRV